MLEVSRDIFSVKGGVQVRKRVASFTLSDKEPTADSKPG